MGSPLFEKPPDFPLSFGIMNVTDREERESDRPEAILPSKTYPLPMYVIFYQQSPRKPRTRNMLVTLSKRRIG